MFYVFVEGKLWKKQRKKSIKSTAKPQKKLQNETGNNNEVFLAFESFNNFRLAKSRDYLNPWISYDGII